MPLARITELSHSVITSEPSPAAEYNCDAFNIPGRRSADYSPLASRPLAHPPAE
jgi:hypothetical protein